MRIRGAIRLLRLYQHQPNRRSRSSNAVYLKTPKRYTAKGSRRPLLNFRWLWLYLLAPLILIPAVLIWDYRDSLSQIVGDRVNKVVISLSTPTPVPTPMQDPGKELQDAFQAGRVNKAIDILRAVGDAAPNEVSVHSLVTTMLTLRSYGTNKPMLDEAVKAAQQAINANPEAPNGWISMALVLDWDGKPQEALSYAMRAKDFNDKDPMVLAVMAEIYQDLQKSDLATKMVDDAIAIAKVAQPIDRLALSHAYYVKALIVSATNGQDAVADYERAWRAATSDPPDPAIPAGYIAQYLAVGYRNALQLDKAVDLLVAAIQRDQDDPILQYQLGSVYFTKGDPNKARTYAEKCRDLDPQQIKCLRLLAILFYRDANWPQALETINKVIALDSKDPNDYLLSGLSSTNLQQCNVAVGVFQTGLTLVEPGDDKMRASLEDALRACGAGSNLIPPTPIAGDSIATPDATAKP
ncbi:MAG: hypothetical protein ABI947_04975 [Chloroflexota bacterium]